VVRLPTKAGLHDGIIRAGIQLGAELGEEGLTMRAIAARLGISVTNIYQHYENKAAIVREVRFHGVAMLNAALIEAGVDGDRAVRLREMSVAYLRFALSNPWLYRQLFDAEELDWYEMPERERAIALSPIETTRENFADGVAQGSFPADLDVSQAVLLTWASLHGVASLLLGGRLGCGHPEFPVPDVHAFIDAFVTNLVAGFRP
jgi:AcrR family transcriptional regulator